MTRLSHLNAGVSLNVIILGHLSIRDSVCEHVSVNVCGFVCLIPATSTISRGSGSLSHQPCQANVTVTPNLHGEGSPCLFL